MIQVGTASSVTNLKFSKIIARTVGGLFTVVYAVLFLPSLAFIPMLGAFSLDAPGVTAFGAVLCISAFATIPLSMPVSIYLIYTRRLHNKYGQMFFFCVLPLLCCVMALLLVLGIICFNELLVN